MSTKAQNLVRRLIDAINRQDYTALHDLVDPDYVYRTPGEEQRGVAGLQGLLTAYHQAFPDLELVIDDMFGAGPASPFRRIKPSGIYIIEEQHGPSI